MLMAHPTVLADLLERYEILRARQDAEDNAEVLQRLDDISYTLCVATGTRDIAAALSAARDRVVQSTRSKADAIRADAVKADI